MRLSHFLRRTTIAACLLTVPLACTTSPPDPDPAPRSGTTGWRATYFKPHEFASKGNGEMRIKPQLVAALDTTRASLGRPIRIISGYRDPAYNDRIGGARNSRHLHGDAVDIDLSRYDHWTRYHLVWRLIENGFTSFGTYGDHPNMLHADMRPSAAIWRHDGGRHPSWLMQALNEWGWRPVYGARSR